MPALDPGVLPVPEFWFAIFRTQFIPAAGRMGADMVERAFGIGEHE